MEVDGDAFQSQQQVLRARHIKKRALKKKAFSVSFNEKDLRYSFIPNYLTFFDRNPPSIQRRATI